MSKNVVKVGDGIEYEPEILTGLTEGKAIDIAGYELWEFSSKRWNWSEETQQYHVDTLKTRHELSIFNGLRKNMHAVLASDKNGAFETVETLFDFARSTPEDFDKVYQAAIKTNPTLIPKEEAAKDPN
jgi:hypothetical protein